MDFFFKETHFSIAPRRKLQFDMTNQTYINKVYTKVVLRRRYKLEKFCHHMSSLKLWPQSTDNAWPTLGQSSIKVPRGECSLTVHTSLSLPSPLTTGGLWGGEVCSEPVSVVGMWTKSSLVPDLLIFWRFGTQKIAFLRFSTNGTMVPDSVPEKSV